MTIIQDINTSEFYYSVQILWKEIEENPKTNDRELSEDVIAFCNGHIQPIPLSSDVKCLPSLVKVGENDNSYLCQIGEYLIKETATASPMPLTISDRFMNFKKIIKE